MTKLAYVGVSHFRQISKADLVGAGIDKDTEGLGALNLARADIDPAHNPKRLSHVADVPQEVADLLLKAEPGDWKIVADDEDAPVSKSAAQGDDTPDATPGVDITDSGEPSITGTAGGSSTARARGGRA
jgi:hypothetical protein